MFRIHLQQTLLAMVALLSGIFVYLFVRPEAPTYFITDFLQPLNIKIFHTFLFSDQLPSFLHTYAFILLTSLVLGVKSKKALWASLSFWVAVEMLFELGQIPSVAVILMSLTPEWFSDFSVLELIDGFFLNGTYDVFDLIAILLAAMAAGLTIQAGRFRGEYQDEN